MDRTHGQPAPDPTRTVVRTIETDGVGSAVAVPDVIVLDLGVSVTDAHVQGALRGAGHILARLHQAVREAGVRGADLRTQGVSVHPYVDPQRDAVSGYQSHQAVTLLVRTDAELETVLTAALEIAGDALIVHGLRQEISDPDALRPTARVRAVQDARAKAEHLAGLFGCGLGSVRWVRDGAGRFEDRGPVLLGAASAEFAAAPIERGELSVTATVQVCWELT